LLGSYIYLYFCVRDEFNISNSIGTLNYSLYVNEKAYFINNIGINESSGSISNQLYWWNKSYFEKSPLMMPVLPGSMMRNALSLKEGYSFNSD
jgi:hypothetical protein